MSGRREAAQPYRHRSGSNDGKLWRKFGVAAYTQKSQPEWVISLKVSMEIGNILYRDHFPVSPTSYQ